MLRILRRIQTVIICISIDCGVLRQTQKKLDDEEARVTKKMKEEKIEN